MNNHLEKLSTSHNMRKVTAADLFGTPSTNKTYNKNNSNTNNNKISSFQVEYGEKKFIKP